MTHAATNPGEGYRPTVKDIYDAYPDCDLLPYDARAFAIPDANVGQWLHENENIAGDTLFLFLVRELVPEDGDDFDLREAIRRANRAIRDIEQVRDALVKKLGHPTEEEARELAEWYADGWDARDVCAAAFEGRVEDYLADPDFYDQQYQERYEEINTEE